jgi:GNAT superfamily N-acetyltransferase
MRETQPLPTIRKATPADSAGILQCLATAFEVYRDRYTPRAFADTVLTSETLQARLATMCLFVAVSDSGEIIGTTGCHGVPPGADPNVDQIVHSPEGHIRGMAVLPEWQGSGIASKLLASVESELRALECSRITLDTTAPLGQAMRFYEKSGFRRSGKVTDFFGMELFEFVKILTNEAQTAIPLQFSRIPP